MKKNMRLATSAVLGGMLIAGAIMPAFAQTTWAATEQQSIPATALTAASNLTTAIQVQSPDALQKSIASIIAAHDLLADSAFTADMDKLGAQLTGKFSDEGGRTKGIGFAYGNLDADYIPELVVFVQRDFANEADEGALVLYKFKDGAYREISRQSMGFDNGSVRMVIGSAAKDKPAIFLNTQVGAHSGETYLFALEDGKLVSRLSGKKISTLSIYTSAEIKDIDNDGITEFSIYTDDPASGDTSSAGSDKMSLWYKWNGKDSASIVKVVKAAINKPLPTDEALMTKFNAALNKGSASEALAIMNMNFSKHSSADNTAMLESYMAWLKSGNTKMSTQLEALFEKYSLKAKKDIFTANKLQIKDLNDPGVMAKAGTLKFQQDLKAIIRQGIARGYRVNTSEGMYYFVVDYQRLANLGSMMSSDLYEYFKIMGLESNKPAILDGAPAVALDELAKRIADIELFSLTYPASKYTQELKPMYREFAGQYLFGYTYDPVTLKLSPQSIASYHKTVKEYDSYFISDIVSAYLSAVEQNHAQVTGKVLLDMNTLLDEEIGKL